MGLYYHHVLWAFFQTYLSRSLVLDYLAYAMDRLRSSDDATEKNRARGQIQNASLKFFQCGLHQV